MIQEAVIERSSVRLNGATSQSKLAAHYDALVQRIRAANLDAAPDQAIETIGVTSCAPGAGVSTVAFNIAIAAARAEMGPVLFVDADLTKQADRLLANSPKLGLADVLADAATPMDCIVGTSIENLSLVSGRGAAKHDGMRFDPFVAAEVLSELKSCFKLLIVDIPAPTELNGSAYLAGKLDGVLLVVESELSDGRTALRTKQQLIDANANLLGVVLNKRRTHVPNWLYNLL